MDDTSVYIMDVYNRGIYPHDGYAKSKYLRHSDIHFNLPLSLMSHLLLAGG